MEWFLNWMITFAFASAMAVALTVKLILRTRSKKGYWCENNHIHHWRLPRWLCDAFQWLVDKF